LEPEIHFDLKEIGNIDKIINDQVKELTKLRELVRDLTFIPVDPVGIYTTVTYKSIDGGKMGIYFDPLKCDFIIIADSSGNKLMKFLIPFKASLTPDDFQFLNDSPEVKKFLQLLNLNSITESSEILTNPEIAMELIEFACIFERLTREKSEPILIMKDGLLRTKALKHEHIQSLIPVLENSKKQKLVGVAKSSKILDLIITALHIENKIPQDYTGYIEIPLEIESIAYKWTKRSQTARKEILPLEYAFGKLYIAKLSKKSNLLVTIEIPHDNKNNRAIYSRSEINEIIGHLIKDSLVSYPILGYPQTIMRAHERAANWGFTASIWKDKIIDRFLNEIKEENVGRLIKDANFLREYVDKGILGGF